MALLIVAACAATLTSCAKLERPSAEACAVYRAVYDTYARDRAVFIRPKVSGPNLAYKEEPPVGVDPYLFALRLQREWKPQSVRGCFEGTVKLAVVTDLPTAPLSLVDRLVGSGTGMVGVFEVSDVWFSDEGDLAEVYIHDACPGWCFRIWTATFENRDGRWVLVDEIVHAVA